MSCNCALAAANRPRQRRIARPTAPPPNLFLHPQPTRAAPSDSSTTSNLPPTTPRHIQTCLWNCNLRSWASGVSSIIRSTSLQGCQLANNARIGPFTHEVSQVLRLHNSNSDPVAFKVKTTAPKQCVSDTIQPSSRKSRSVLMLCNTDTASAPTQAALSQVVVSRSRSSFRP